MKLSGWQRVGIVAIIVWALGISLYLFTEINNDAVHTAQTYYSICDSANSRDHTNNNCWDAYSKNYDNSKRESYKEWWIFPLAIFIPPLLIFIIWLFSYGILKTFYWIRAGFYKSDQSPKMLKWSIFLTIGIILYFVFFFTISILHESAKKSSFEANAAQCQLEVLKSKISGDNSNEFIINCMKAKGYFFGSNNPMLNCSGDYDATYYGCYK